MYNLKLATSRLSIVMALAVLTLKADAHAASNDIQTPSLLNDHPHRRETKKKSPHRTPKTKKAQRPWDSNDNGDEIQILFATVMHGSAHGSGSQGVSYDDSEDAQQEFHGEISTAPPAVTHGSKKKKQKTIVARKRDKSVDFPMTPETKTPFRELEQLESDLSSSAQNGTSPHVTKVGLGVGAVVIFAVVLVAVAVRLKKHQPQSEQSSTDTWDCETIITNPVATGEEHPVFEELRFSHEHS